MTSSANHTQPFQLAIGSAASYVGGNSTSHSIRQFPAVNYPKPMGFAARLSAGTAAKPKWIVDGFAAIELLEADWDGYGSPPIGDRVINQMRSLLDRVLPADGAPGHIVPGSDGSLQAEWHVHEGSFGLVVDDEGVPNAWLRVAGVERERSGIEAIEMVSTIARSLLHV
ncbi:hypothetical protein [Sphingobium naphthae]|uniref:Uncharacterized protein n=1 Tax=Sphingobium naphthae TaxID=1886786 RepID=A0ABU3ZUC5_9SPHN|nr:hypothetical protein [Sphingobium naphthae]MDV5823096.1 hypothetical protein [Sphingobium naphthae]